MSSPALETYLATLYTDTRALERFLADPHGEAARAGLDLHEVEAMCCIDRVGLQMAAASYAQKRKGRQGRWSLWQRLFESF